MEAFHTKAMIWINFTSNGLKNLQIQKS